MRKWYHDLGHTWKTFARLFDLLHNQENRVTKNNLSSDNLIVFFPVVFVISVKENDEEKMKENGTGNFYVNDKGWAIGRLIYICTHVSCACAGAGVTLQVSVITSTNSFIDCNKCVFINSSCHTACNSLPYLRYTTLRQSFPVVPYLRLNAFPSNEVEERKFFFSRSRFEVFIKEVVLYFLQLPSKPAKQILVSN